MAIAFQQFGGYSDGARSQWRPTEKRLTTCLGILRRLSRFNLRLLCFECGGMGIVTDCVDVQDNKASVTVDCELSCGHCRNLTIAVKSEMCECEARWMYGQWCHEVNCQLKENEASARRES